MAAAAEPEKWGGAREGREERAGRREPSGERIQPRPHRRAAERERRRGAERGGDDQGEREGEREREGGGGRAGGGGTGKKGKGRWSNATSIPEPPLPLSPLLRTRQALLEDTSSSSPGAPCLERDLRGLGFWGSDGAVYSRGESHCEV